MKFEYSVITDHSSSSLIVEAKTRAEAKKILQKIKFSMKTRLSYMPKRRIFFDGKGGSYYETITTDDEHYKHYKKALFERY